MHSPASRPKKLIDRVGQRILAIPSAAPNGSTEHCRIASRAPTPAHFAVLGLVPIKYYKAPPTYSNHLGHPSATVRRDDIGVCAEPVAALVREPSLSDGGHGD